VEDGCPAPAKEWKMERKILWAGAWLLGLLLVVAGYITIENRNHFQGVVISPSPQAPEFSSLSDQYGHNVSLQDLKGKVVLVFFGYTNCPDECPATLAKLKQTVSGLNNKAKDVVVIMITTDPSRDTPDRIRSYLSNFNPDFLGLTGTLPNLVQTYKNYGVTVLDNGETHSALVYAIDKSGKLRLTFPPEMDPTAMLSDVQNLLRE
jgi:protein SCO1